MSIYRLAFVALATLLMVVFVTACASTSTGATTTPMEVANPIPLTATPALIPSGWKVFTSQKYHYSIGYPGDWKVAQAMEMLSGGIPHSDDDTVDSLRSPGGPQTGMVVIAAQQVAEGTTLEGWTATTIQNYRNDGACESAARESLRVGGEPATFLVYSPCLAYYILHVALVHGRAGFLLYWLSNPGNEAKDRTTFEQFLATLAFPT